MKILVLLLVGCCAFVPTAPVGAYTFEKSLTADGAGSEARRLTSDPYIDYSDTYVFPAEPELLSFWFEHLPVAGSLARVSGTVDLWLESRGPRSYGVRTKHDLEGHCYRLDHGPGGTRYVGRGTYRQDYVPFDIRGTVLMDLDWRRREEGRGVILRVRLRMIPSSNVLRLMGTVFSPFVRLAMVDVLDRVVDVGRKFSRTVRHHPHLIGLKLSFQNARHAHLWENFTARHNL